LVIGISAAMPRPTQFARVARLMAMPCRAKIFDWR
jgi:hypothetical protein